MKTLLTIIALTYSYNSFGFTQCVSWDEQKNQCYSEVDLADQESVNFLAREIEKQKVAMAENEKRLKGEMIKLVSEARKQIVLDLLNDSEMRTLIKEKIKSLEAK